ncbi:MAG: GNAT family N-acetyltransferase [Chitinophagaceae bacterium]|nr:GNAT family N-acetyltransferase [Chitinophagaceae bacterium]
MNLTYRQGTLSDLAELKKLAVKSWIQFKPYLTDENWNRLHNSLTDEKTYTELISKSYSIVCTTDRNEIIGMAFLVGNGNPTEIYDKDWCHIRLVTVDPDFSGQGVGKKLTATCIDVARRNNEKVISLHTSELMDKARHIYESLGFKILREIDQRLGKRYWLYTLDLTYNQEV